MAAQLITAADSSAAFAADPAVQSQVPSGPVQPTTKSASDSPQGSWVIVPGVLTVNWRIDGTNLKVTLNTVFGIQVAEADGTINNDEIKISDNISLFGIVTGDGSVEAVWNSVDGGDAPGLWVAMNLNVLGQQWVGFKYNLLTF